MSWCHALIDSQLACSYYHNAQQLVLWGLVQSGFLGPEWHNWSTTCPVWVQNQSGPLRPRPKRTGPEWLQPGLTSFFGDQSMAAGSGCHGLSASWWTMNHAIQPTDCRDIVIFRLDVILFWYQHRYSCIKPGKFCKNLGIFREVGLCTLMHAQTNWSYFGFGPVACFSLKIRQPEHADSDPDATGLIVQLQLLSVQLGCQFFCDLKTGPQNINHDGRNQS